MKSRLIIPAILAAIVLAAGMFLFIPIEKASTVHTTLISAAVGYTCVTKTLTVSTAGGAFHADTVRFTFTGEGSPISIVFLSAAVTSGGAVDESFGILNTANSAGDFTGPDDADMQLALDDAAADTPDIAEREFLGVAGLDYGIFVESKFELVIDDDEAAQDIDNNDVITFEICGLARDPVNFTDADVSVTQVAAT